jgi:signal transduction histidine kinase
MSSNASFHCFDDGTTCGVGPGTREELGAVGAPTSDFLATFSHELRNSLGAIRNASRVLRTEVSASAAQVNARLIIERQVQQMTRLVDDLLDVSRIRTGKLQLECERIELCNLVGQALQAVQFLMQQRSHRVTVSLPESSLWLHGDPVRLEQVFVNLLTNAAKYTDVGGEIRVSVTQEQGEATLRVRDTGIGIAPHVLPHVFDLYLQVKSASRNPGLGLGLPLVRSLVERHGGSVTAASAGLGCGSEFMVRLPILAS